jgi:nitrate reductase gamma subunit
MNALTAFADPMDFLLFVKGPLFNIAIAIFALGLSVRILEILVNGRRHNFSQPRAGEWLPGLKTVFSRTVPDPGTFQRAPFNVVVGLIWHLGFIITLLLFIPHIAVLKGLLGISWPGLPNPLVDLITALTLVALAATLVHRLTHPVKRRISTVQDYLVWALTFLVVLTGYLAYNRLITPYPLALGLHILAAEVFLIVLPFTKLTHIFTAFIARWYTGASFGRRGVPS